MENLKMIPVLFLFLMAQYGDMEPGGVSGKDYSEFKAIPDYIAHPTPERKAYFEAYDKTMKKWKVDYEELYIETSKGTAHIIVSGPQDATPVVLMNGMAASATMWYPNAKDLSEEHRVYGIDLIIEPGKSFKTEDIKNIEGVTAWYQEVMDILDLKSYHLIGTSRGGWLATDLALEDKRVKSVVLLSPVQTFIWVPPSIGLLKNMMNIFYPKEKRAMRTMETLSKDATQIDPDYIEQYRIALENDTLNKFMVQMKPFSRRKLRSLPMPVLLLIGDDDLFNTPRSVRKAEKLIPKAQGEVIVDSGHFLTIDQTDLVNDKILNFLKKVDRSKQVEEMQLDQWISKNSIGE